MTSPEVPNPLGQEAMSVTGNSPVAHIRCTQPGIPGIQTVEAHLTAVGRRSRKSASILGLGHAGELLGLVHDLGKYSSAFQNYLASAVGLLDQDVDVPAKAKDPKARIDHSTAGAQFLWEALSFGSPTDQALGQILALCVASHHSGLIDCLGCSPDHPVEATFLKRMGKADDQTSRTEAMRKAGAEVLEQTRQLLLNPELRDSFKSLLIRIGDQVRKQGGGRQLCDFQLGMLARFLFSGLLDADRTDTARFMSGEAIEADEPSKARSTPRKFLQ